MDLTQCTKAVFEYFAVIFLCSRRIPHHFLRFMRTKVPLHMSPLECFKREQLAKDKFYSIIISIL